jgi:DNA-directed DNA polymerase III PolC
VIHLDVNTGFGFLKAYGLPKQIISKIKSQGEHCVGIADVNSTWGHIPFWDEAKKAGVKPLFGVKLCVYPSLDKSVVHDIVTLIAMNNLGLREQYEFVSLATSQFYYRSRVTWQQLRNIKDNFIIINSIKPDTIHFLKRFNNNMALGATPSRNYFMSIVKKSSLLTCISCDPRYVNVDDEEPYKLVRAIEQRTYASQIRGSENWIFTEDELDAKFFEAGIDEYQQWVENNAFIAKSCNAEPIIGENIKPDVDETLHEMCLRGAKKKNINLNSGEYKARYQHEMELIKEKGFEDYFLMIADLVKWAKRRMFVGPARGSSAGSLVCYLSDIVEVNPLKHDLLFERFIDINREDLPDIDIDFPDSRRDEIFEFLKAKYGNERVARIGTVSVFKPKSALRDAAFCYNITRQELRVLTDVIIERSSGDARANMAIEDTINQFEVGQKLVEKHPKLLVAAKIEGHPRHTGKHAAGIIVCDRDVSNYFAINKRGNFNVGMLSKDDAEKIGLLKIDALGLKTLSVIQDCCEQVGIDPQSLYTLPLDDDGAFQIFQDDKVAGVFQFEGYAVRSLMKQMGVEKFYDIVALTALARPGPLHCGAASEFIDRKNGVKEWTHKHELLKPITKDTYGCIVYQEQVMYIARQIGAMSWQDVSELRKAMSKSKGEEFFNKYKLKFDEGCKEKSIDPKLIDEIWEEMCTFGSWAFNLSHAVSYGLISYWCAYLKHYYPQAFAVAHLRRTESEDHVIRFLRELRKEGFAIIPFDLDNSEKNWSFRGDGIYGGFLSVKGIGDKTADKIIEEKNKGGEWLDRLTPSIRKKLKSPNNTPWHNITRLSEQYADIYANPGAYKINSDVIKIEDIDDVKGSYCFIGNLKVINLRDLNETLSLAKRGGREIRFKNLFLNLTLEDDTGSILCCINRFKYDKLGKPLMEQQSEGSDFLIRGDIIEDGKRRIFVTKLRRLE